MTAGTGLLFIVGADANNAGFLEIRALPGLTLAQTKDLNPLPLSLPANGLALTPDGSRLYVAQRSATGLIGWLAPRQKQRLEPSLVLAFGERSSCTCRCNEPRPLAGFGKESAITWSKVFPPGPL